MGDVRDAAGVRRAGEALYERLYREIRDQIVSGAIEAGARLPSKRRLAESAGVSVVTVEGAYRQLVAEGYVVARPRSGYFAARLPRPEVTVGSPLAAAPAEGARSAGAVGGGRSARPAGRAAVPGSPDGHVFDLAGPARTADAAASLLWARALRHALSAEPEDEVFSATPGRGLPRLRAAIASYLGRARGMAVEPGQVVVGAGAQLLYCLVAQAARGLGPVAVEDPGYPRLAAIYRANGLDVRAVGLDAEGMSMAGLRESGARVAHVMPSHQFPTGLVTSVARRFELLGWASGEPGGLVVEDDYDSELRLAGRPVPPLASMDELGRVAYLNTFSKSLATALRMAYLVVPPGLEALFGPVLGCYSCTVSAVDQVALACVLEDGSYERHVRRYRTQRRAVRDALVGELLATPEGARMRVESADAGLHLVLVVEGAGEGELVAEAARRGLRVAGIGSYATGGKGGVAAGACGVPGGDGDDAAARLVVQYDSLSEQDVPAVAQRLAAAVGACRG